MIEEFQEFSSKLIAEQKAILDQKTHTGTIANMSERIELFQSGLKILNDILTQKANEFLSTIDINYESNESLKKDLQSVATKGINDYIKYFKGE